MNIAASDDGSAAEAKPCQTVRLGVNSFVTATFGGPPRTLTSSSKTIRFRLAGGDVSSDSTASTASTTTRLPDENSIESANNGKLIWRPVPSAVKGVAVEPFVMTAADVVVTAVKKAEAGSENAENAEKAAKAEKRAKNAGKGKAGGKRKRVSESDLHYADYDAILPFACKTASDRIAVKPISTAFGGGGDELYLQTEEGGVTGMGEWTFEMLGDVLDGN